MSVHSSSVYSSRRPRPVVLRSVLITFLLLLVLYDFLPLQDRDVAVSTASVSTENRTVLAASAIPFQSSEDYRTAPGLVNQPQHAQSGETPSLRRPQSLPKQRPSLPPPPEITPIHSSPHAYAFYVTDANYACGALINILRLHDNLDSSVPAIVIASPSVPEDALSALSGARGTTVIRAEAPERPGGEQHHGYYAQVLLKLRALQLHEPYPNLERVIALDADQYVVKNIDHLFSLPAGDLAAPRAYWLDHGAIASTLLVADVGEELWALTEDALASIPGNEMDMDLINRVFKNRLTVLPGRYCTLNSHWEALDLPGWFGGRRGKDALREDGKPSSETLRRLWDEVEVLHYTAYNKPWDVNLEVLRANRPNAHPLLVEQFRIWQDRARRVCPFVHIKDEMF